MYDAKETPRYSARDWADMWGVLADVESGKVEARSREPLVKGFNGDVTYELSNGWKVVVYSHYGVWDYTAQMIAPDGRVFVFELSPEEYRPPPELLERVWFWPTSMAVPDPDG